MAGVEDLDLHRVLDGARADRHAAIGRRVPDRVLDQVEEDALDLLGVGSRCLEVLRQLGADRDRAGLRLGAHRVDGLEHEVLERHPFHRPADVAGLQTRELEQVVDHGAHRAHVDADPRDVFQARRSVDDVVGQRRAEQPQRGQRRADVVGDRGQQLAPGVLERRARVFFALQGRRQLLDVAGDERQLVAALGRDLHVALDRRRRACRPRLSSSMSPSTAARDRAGAPRAHDARVEGQHRREQRVGRGVGHQRDEQAGGKQQLADDDRPADGQLASHPADARADGEEALDHQHRQQADGGEDREACPARVAAVGKEADERSRERRAERHEDARRRAPERLGAHGWNR